MIRRDAKTRKRDLRRTMRERNRRSSDSERAQAGELICRLFQSIVVGEFWRTVLFYAPLAGEPDIWPLLPRAVDDGVRVLLPRLDEGRGLYEAAEVVSPADDLCVGRFGVREPRAHCSAVPLNSIDAVLVPGVAFDLAGHRLGRGAGFYDRMLSETSGERIGIAFDWQISESVPTETHDVYMTRILTPMRHVICEETKKRRQMPPFQSLDG